MTLCTILISALSGVVGIFYGYGISTTALTSTLKTNLYTGMRVLFVGIFFYSVLTYTNIGIIWTLIPFIAGIWLVMFIKIRQH